jgi:hypothetical protein
VSVKPLLLGVVNALNALDLPEHRTVKYRRPRDIQPADCPMLVVWVEAKVPTPVTTATFDGVVSLGVSWHLAAVKEAQTLVEDEALSVALLDAIELIENEIRRLADVGVPAAPGAWQILPGETLYLPPEMAQGLTEGYVTEAVCRIAEKWEVTGP